MSAVSPIPIEVRAQAIARYQETLDAARTARELGLSERTVQRYVARWRQVSPEEVVTQDERIAYLGGEIILDSLDTIQDMPREQQLKYLDKVIIARGVSIDKQIKRADASNPNDRGNTFVFINAPTSDIQSIVEVASE